MHSVLIVDDEKVIRDGCSRLLTREGFRVLTAVDGREALDLLKMEIVDVILCDLVMPVMGAFEVLEHVKANYPDLPLIVITGHGTVSNAVEAIKKGALDFITKPFRADHLVLMTRRAIERRDLEFRARELQEAEARNLYDLAMEKSRIRAIVNCMADGVLVTNRDLEVVLHNPALMRLLELSTSLEYPFSLTDCRMDDEVVGSIRAISCPGAEKNALITRQIRRGEKCILAVSAPVPGPGDEPVGAVTVLQDVTAMKRLDEMKTNFVHMVSHELRSPLASIKQLLTVVLEGMAGELTDRQKDLLGRSDRKIQDLLNLINDLLDVAKIENGGAVRPRAPLNLAGVLEHTVALIMPRAEGHNVVLKLDVPPDLPLIMGDSQGMEELFTNLLSNAINYSPDGGEVRISAVITGEYLQVSVSDNGIGIDPEEISKIFDRFYRIKHPRTREVRGTGLGLSIVKATIEAHRGQIRVESQPGVGTTFHVLLPLIR